MDKNVSKDVYNAANILNKCCSSFELSFQQRIRKNMYDGFLKNINQNNWFLHW